MTAGVGTSLWMAPEVMLGQRYDEKADVFSFGVILSELDTHELPYDHARDPVSGQKISNMVLMQQISEGKLKPRFTSMADPEMVSLARDCLEVDPTKRPLASQVLYRIHRSRRNDRRMAQDTRTAIDRSLLTVNTVASTRYDEHDDDDDHDKNESAAAGRRDRRGAVAFGGEQAPMGYGLQHGLTISTRARPPRAASASRPERHEHPDPSGNAPDRAKICLQPACQKQFTVFRSLIDTECPGALNEVTVYPNGMYTTTFCPPIANPIPPPTPPPTPPPAAPPPTAPAPPPRTVPPTTAAPPATEPPPQPTTSSPTPTTSEPTSSPLTIVAPLATSTPEVRESVTPSTTSPRSGASSAKAPTVPSPETAPGPPVNSVTSAPTATTSPPAAISASKSGVSTTTVATAGGGGCVVLIALIIIAFVLRRRRKTSSPQEEGEEVAKDPEQRYARSEYTNFSNAPTEDTYTQSGVLEGGRELTKKRIPYRALGVGQVVSQGGFGEIVKGTYNNQVVAVKRLLAARRSHQDNIDSVFEEIKLTATLEHDCLVRFIGYAWTVPTNLCMVSEFMHGGDLRTLMVKYATENHPNVHDDAKLRILEPVSRALQYLHGQDPPVVHRDLKSRNILLSSQGDAKVIDFGISCERQDYTMAAGLGTRLWMAPEVMLGERYGEKADVFSFGVVLCELDTLTLPYDHARSQTSNKKLNDVKLMQLISQGKIHPRFTNVRTRRS